MACMIVIKLLIDEGKIISDWRSVAGRTPILCFISYLSIHLDIKLLIKSICDNLITQSNPQTPRWFELHACAPYYGPLKLGVHKIYIFFASNQLLSAHFVGHGFIF